MGSDWVLGRLGDHVDACLGKMLDQKKNKGELHPYIGNKNVRWGSFELDDLLEMRFEDHEHERYGLQYGDLVVCEGGVPGRCAIWKNEIPNMKIQKALHRIRTHKSLNNYYLHYWFTWSGNNGLLDAYFTGTTIKHLSGKALSNIEIPIPPIEIQERIARILGSLDDKIELNRQMNETLEAMAQALFKSWFVDFDPVLDNALAAGNPIPDELSARAEQRQALPPSDSDNHAIRALFPDAFEFTEEMGWIPRGWGVKNLTEVAEFQNGFAFYTTGYSDTGYKVVDLANISISGRFIETHRDKHVSSEIYNLPKHEKHQLKINDIVMAMTDITQAMGILGKCGKIYESNKYILNQRIGRIRVFDGINVNFLLTYLNSTYQLNFLKIRSLGTVQKYVNTTHIKEMNFVIPETQVMNRFGSIVDPIFNKMRIADEENETLAKLRDTLLPKLLSGELRMTDAAAMVDKV